MQPTERSQLSLFQLATQYYASGRFAALSGILPVSGNLLHHAIEMYLKGALAPVLDLKAMRKLRHDLQQIWVCAKQSFPSSNLIRFDTAIDRLNPFERLRYPDAVLREGAQMRLTRLRSEWLPAPANPGRTEPVYDLVLEEVDELVKAIFSVANLNPAFFSSGLNPRALAVLSEANPHAIFGA
jgi:hypothetical protein